MSKQTREEEQKAKKEIKEGEKEKKRGTSFYGSTEPETMHCRRCRTLMENGVCPTCGFKTYVPMDEGKRKKIKMVGTAIGLAVFIVIFLVVQFTKG
jgi:predicted RNA-binding Zn-ribbon protein involved in translation (DUF1610 family)